MALNDFERRLVAMFLSIKVLPFQSFLVENEIDGSQAEAIIDELNKPDGLIGRDATAEVYTSIKAQRIG